MTIDWKTEREIVVIALNLLAETLKKKGLPTDAELLVQVQEVRRTYGCPS